MKYIFKLLPLIVLISLAFLAKQSGFFEKTAETLGGMGAWAGPAFLGAYVLSCLLFFPSAVMTCMAGALFPFPTALLLALSGTVLGSTAALFIGRYSLTSWAEQKAAQYPLLRQLDDVIRSEGWKIPTLLRLTPIFPFSIGNYLFGTTSISTASYALAAFLGTIPSAVVYVWMGRLTGISGKHATGPAEWGLLIIGIFALFFLSWHLKKFFDRILSNRAV